MKHKAYLLVFGGLADWEPAHALCEIRRSRKLDVVTAGFSMKPITTMAGLRLTPDVTLEDVNPAEAGIFILPGGDMWEQTSNQELKSLLLRLHAERVLIAAICAATLEIARAGLTGGVRHTSNSKKYLKSMVPEYSDDSFYVDELAVTDQNLITASGLGSVEFAREVIRELGIYSAADTRIWYEMYKHGMIPAGMT
jgi:putative intracellular protease/amidase